MKNKFKLTALERSWILYDIGNSAFILLVATLVPIYFESLTKAGGVQEHYLSYWSFAGSISTLIVAIVAPSVVHLRTRTASKSPCLWAVCFWARWAAPPLAAAGAGWRF